MTSRMFPPTALAAAILVAAPALAQTGEPAEGDEAPRATFERRYIDASARRGDQVLLRDWPELDRLVRWAHRVESAVVSADSTLSGELIESFRARVDTLAATPPPEFLAARADSVKSVIAAIRADLERADEAFEARPREVRPTGRGMPNVPERQRTLVTGRTAVTVPAGVAVGENDTLPGAEVSGEEPATPLDFVGDALADLDRLVHLVRSAGRPAGEAVSGEPATPRDGTSRGTAPPPRER